MELKIEKNIPIPEKKRRSAGMSAALRKLEVGDSVFLKDKTIQQIGSIVKNADLVGRTTSRTLDGGVRVWRIK